MSLYSVLNDQAQSWWFNKTLRSQGQIAEARRRERKSISDHVSQFRSAIEHHGFMHYGRGGWTLYYDPNARLQGYDDHMVAATILAGIPVVDTTTIDHPALVAWAVMAPIPTLDPRQWEPYSGGFSYSDPITFIQAAHMLGAKVRNVAPEMLVPSATAQKVYDRIMQAAIPA